MAREKAGEGKEEEEEDELGTLGTVDCAVSKLANVSRARGSLDPSVSRYAAVLYEAAVSLFRFASLLSRFLSRGQ